MSKGCHHSLRHGAVASKQRQAMQAFDSALEVAIGTFLYAFTILKGALR
jgi:hypothetical protein